MLSYPEMSTIKENLAFCLRRIATAAERVGREATSVTLVAVAKGFKTPQVLEALDAGVRNIGENKIQEALLKYDDVNKAAQSKGVCLNWHMIGHLQTNKVRQAVRIFCLIHSVDSIRLAEIINKEAAKICKIQYILLEVNVSGELSKYGFSTDSVQDAFTKIRGLGNLRLQGLMMVAPLLDDPEKARPAFRRFCQLADDLAKQRFLPRDYKLSMGMSDDFPVAVEEGATMVRIGRAIFGERKDD